MFSNEAVQAFLVCRKAHRFPEPTGTVVTLLKGFYRDEQKQERRVLFSASYFNILLNNFFM